MLGRVMALAAHAAPPGTPSPGVVVPAGPTPTVVATLALGPSIQRAVPGPPFGLAGSPGRGQRPGAVRRPPPGAGPGPAGRPRPRQRRPGRGLSIDVRHPRRGR